jgi:hypothetical protein
MPSQANVDPAQLDFAALSARDISKLNKPDLVIHFSALQKQYAERGQKYGTTLSQ